jgi:hypothetical protein
MHLLFAICSTKQDKTGKNRPWTRRRWKFSDSCQFSAAVDIKNLERE